MQTREVSKVRYRTVIYQHDNGDSFSFLYCHSNFNLHSDNWKSLKKNCITEIHPIVNCMHYCSSRSLKTLSICFPCQCYTNYDSQSTSICMLKHIMEFPLTLDTILGLFQIYFNKTNLKPRRLFKSAVCSPFCLCHCHCNYIYQNAIPSWHKYLANIFT